MRWVGIVVGVLLTLMGAVWLLQGIGVIGGSVMSGQSFWAAAGLVALVVGLGLLYASLRRRRTTSPA